MPINSLKKPLPLMTKGEFGKINQVNKNKFKEVDRIASSVNWDVHYAIYKPEPPSVEEILWFKEQVDKLRREIEAIKLKFPFVDYQTLNTLESRLSKIEEEFETYPFSDRKFFFSQRLKFFRKLLRESIYSCNEQGS